MNCSTPGLPVHHQLPIVYMPGNEGGKTEDLPTSILSKTSPCSKKYAPRCYPNRRGLKASPTPYSLGAQPGLRSLELLAAAPALSPFSRCGGWKQAPGAGWGWGRLVGVVPPPRASSVHCPSPPPSHLVPGTPSWRKGSQLTSCWLGARPRHCPLPQPSR